MPQGGARGQNLGHPNKIVYCSLFIQIYTNSLLIKKDEHQTCLYINIQCNKVKDIVILFSCSSDFALYFEDCFTDKCLNKVVCCTLFIQTASK